MDGVVQEINNPITISSENLKIITEAFNNIFPIL